MAFELVESVLSLQPRREFRLFGGFPRKVLLASDASYEAGVGRAGFLLVVDPGGSSETRRGFEVTVPQEFYRAWGLMGTYISQLELLVVFMALVAQASQFRGARGMIFVDNTPALVALVKGGSQVRTLEVRGIELELVRRDQ